MSFQRRLTQGLLAACAAATLIAGQATATSPSPGTVDDTLAPAPSIQPDQELESRFPVSVGGRELKVQSIKGGRALVEVADQEGRERWARFESALAGQGKTLDDMSFATASLFDAAGHSGDIFALRVDGADMSTLTPDFIAMMTAMPDAVTETAVIDGREVLTITDPHDDPLDPDGVRHLLASGDTLWMVEATMCKTPEEYPCEWVTDHERLAEILSHVGP